MPTKKSPTSKIARVPTGEARKRIARTPPKKGMSKAEAERRRKRPHTSRSK